MKKLFILILAGMLITLVGCNTKTEPVVGKVILNNTEVVEEIKETVEEEKVETVIKLDSKTEPTEDKESKVTNQLKEEVVNEKVTEPVVNEKVTEPVVIEKVTEETKPVRKEEPVESIKEKVIVEPACELIKQKAQAKKSNTLMTPYPSNYAYMPDDYNLEEILDWYRNKDTSDYKTAYLIGGASCYSNLMYMGNKTLVAAVEACVSEGMNPWCRVEDEHAETLAGVATARTKNFDGTEDLMYFYDSSYMYNVTFREECEIAIEGCSKYNASWDCEPTVIDGKVPQNIADNCHINN